MVIFTNRDVFTTLSTHNKWSILRLECGFPLTIPQLWSGWTGSHLIGVGGGLLLIALAVASILVVASLLAVLGLVASLGAGVGVLLAVAGLAEGVRGGLLLL